MKINKIISYETNGWMDGWIHKLINRLFETRTDYGWMDGQAHGNELMNGLLNTRTDDG